MAVNPPVQTSATQPATPGGVASVLVDGRYQLRLLDAKNKAFTTYTGMDMLIRQRVYVQAFQLSELTEGVARTIEQDARQWMKIFHPHLVRVLDATSWQGLLLVIDEEVGGPSLAKVQESGPLRIADTLSIGCSILEGLERLHKEGRVHGGVTSSNILFKDRTDLSSCKLRFPAMSHAMQCERASQERLLELATYAAPEQSGIVQGELTPASDLYSLGCVLYHCLAGEPPYRSSDLSELLLLQATQPVPGLRERGLQVPRALDEIITQALSRDAQDRYQSARGMLRDLKSVQESISQGNDDPATVVGTGDTRTRLKRPGFVGREDELALVDREIHQVRSGKSDLLIIEGLSGHGKSTLLKEFTQRCQQNGFAVYKSRAQKEPGQAFQTLDGIIDGFLDDVTTTPELAARLQESLGELTADLSAALPRLKETFTQGRTGDAESRPSAESRTTGAIVEFLNSLGTKQRPAVIILDDCQWDAEFVAALLMRWKMVTADRSGAERFTEFAISFRSEEVGQESPLRRLPARAHLILEGMKDAEIRRVTESMAGQLPETVIQLICRLSQGSPFMASAILDGLSETGVIRPGPAGWDVDQEALSKAHSSTSAGAFLLQRIDLLTPQTRMFLAVGALLGTEFDFEMAQVLAGIPVEQARKSMTEAHQRNLLWWEHEDQRCSFVHDKIREAFQSLLTADEGRSLHERAARHLLLNSPERCAELAYHFDAAGLTREALDYALKAAGETRARHALELAEQQYRIALKCLAQLPDVPAQQRFRIVEGLGEVLMLRGRYDEAEQQFVKATAYVSADDAAADLFHRRGELCMKRGDMEGALEYFHSGIRKLGKSVPANSIRLCFGLTFQFLQQTLHTLFPAIFVKRTGRDPDSRERLLLRLYSGYSHASWYCGNYGRGIWAHLRGLNMGEKFAPSLELAQAYSDHGPAMVLARYTSRAIRYVEKSLEIRRRFNDAWGQGQAYHYYGIALYSACRYEECIEKCQMAIRMLERMGDFWQVHIARYQVAACHYRLGRLPDAITVCQQNYDSGILLGDEQASGIILDVWARATGGKLPTEILEQELKRQRRDAQGTAQVLLASAVHQLAQGAPLESIRILWRARKIIERAGVQNPYTLPVYSWMTTAYRVAAEQDRSLNPSVRRNLVTEGIAAGRIALLMSMRFPMDKPLIWRELGILELMRGKPLSGRRNFNRSMKIAKAQGAAYDFALTLQELGRAGREFGWKNADANTETARALIQNLTRELYRHEASDAAPTTSNLSLVDRFDTLLNVGRRIISALSHDVICEEVKAAARRLLRAEKADLFWVNEEALKAEEANRPELGQIEQLMRDCVRERTVKILKCSDPYETIDGIRSMLCVPVQVRGEVVACLTAEHGQIAELFGRNEDHIAGFIATLAGAAFENSEGFAELEQLNRTLEQRVADRTARLRERADELALSNRQLERLTNELTEAQHQLEKSVDLAREANAAKSRFLAAMSHEIRTPLNGIIGMTELALATDLTDRQRMYLGTVGSSGKALLTMLNDVLDFSRIEAGKLEIDSMQFDLHQLVAEAVRLLAVTGWKKGLDVNCRIAPEVPVHVIGDPNRLRQVLNNLLGNAIKFTERGSVDLDISLNSDGSGVPCVSFAVRDTGIGIPQDRLCRIFTAFDQGEVAITRQYGGTGLGLAISSQLVQLMGGTIQVESALGQGSCFTVQVPLVRGPEDLHREGQETIRLDFQPSSVVYSANPDNASYWEGVLRAEKLQTIRAGNPDEVKLLLAGTKPVNLLLLDVGVSFVQEETLLRGLQDSGLLDQTTVIALVPPGAEQVVDRLQRAGANSVLVKPVKYDELWKSIRQVSAQRGTPRNSPSTANTGGGRENESLKVLIADDSPVNLAVAHGMLELLGHKSVCVEGGREAIEALQTARFDAVFMDLEMPDLNGLETTAMIRQEETASGQHTPIFAMSAHVLDEVLEKCREANMDGFVSKPIQPEELRRILGELRQSRNDSVSSSDAGNLVTGQSPLK